MGLEKIQVTNFKSFDYLEIELGNFNVLIGANAAGKSNFIQIFKFLKDISIFGLKNAVSMQGGVEFLRNINIGVSKNFILKAIVDLVAGFGSKKKEEISLPLKYFIRERIYEFILKFEKRGFGFEIAKDIFTEKYINSKSKNNAEDKIKKYIYYRDKDKIKLDKQPPGQNSFGEYDDYHLKNEEIYPDHLLLESLSNTYLLKEVFKNISIYDFDPKLPKKATPITGKAELEDDGSNLSIILRNIMDNKEKKRKLYNLVNDLLPFITELDVEKFADQSLLIKLQETYADKQYLPASLISDGTISLTALIVALYFEEKPFTIIEEPERNIHPHLISKVVSMMKDASQKKQIVVTTHNPEIVKHAGLENLLLVYRDSNGYSKITRPANKHELKTFLQNEIGIEELYVQNLLGV